MKKLMMTLALLTAVLSMSAQVPLNADGAYEKKIVEKYDSTSAQTLYIRTLEFLSDWTGSNKRSKVNIDVQDKENALVFYKGSYYMGFRKFVPGAVWDVFADFTLKVKCKDGRAQLSIIVPTLSFQYSCDASAHCTVPLSDLTPEYRYNGRYIIKKTALEYAPKVPSTIDTLLSQIAESLHKEAEDF